MGWDTTFHLVDLRAIREELVPKLLGERTAPTPLDEHHPRAEERWNEVRAALQHAPPDEAALELCRLAIDFSGAYLPYQYERGVGFSLLEFNRLSRYDGGISPEVLFGRIVEVHPQLAGHFPERFTGGGTTGALIPTSETLSAARWLEETLAREAPDAGWAGLIRTLKEGARRGLAVWEATDLGAPVVPGRDDLVRWRARDWDPPPDLPAGVECLAVPERFGLRAQWRTLQSIPAGLDRRCASI